MPRKAARDYAAEYQRRETLARSQGFSSYYAKRLASAQREGFTPTQARGHARRDEIGAAEYRKVERSLTDAARAYVVDTKVKGKPATVLIVIDERGRLQTSVFAAGRADSLRKTIEARNRVRRRRGLPDIAMPETTP